MKNSSTKSSIKCPFCKNSAHIKVKKINDKRDNQSIISSFKCTYCDIKEDKTTDDNDTSEKEDETELIISAYFRDKSQLSRKLVLKRQTKLTIYRFNDIIFSYIAEKTKNTNLKKIIRGVISDIHKNFINPVACESVSAEYIEKAKDDVRFLKEMIHRPDYLIKIVDKSGMSGIYPITIEKDDSDKKEKMNEKRSKDVSDESGLFYTLNY